MSMKAPPLTFHPPEALLKRLTRSTRPVVFLVGSALTMPVNGSRGVSTVAQMLDLIRARVGTPVSDDLQARLDAQDALRELDKALVKGAHNGAKYQIAFEHLKGWDGGADAVNTVIREAVLKARTVPVPAPLPDLGALLRLEAEPDGWYLGRAVKALGLILARHRERFGQLVLTTNFDPLVEIAVRAAGGQAMVIDQLGDGALPEADAVVTPVAHVHGSWRSDTLHTPRALMVERGALQRSLTKLYGEVSLVVMGYGGWDDVLMAAIADLAKSTKHKADVLWCFYEDDPAKITNGYPDLVELLGKLGERSVCYSGVDCNDLLPKLRARLDGEHEIIGRGSLCKELWDAQQGQRAVEIIGEHKMKRSDVLEWLARQTTLQGGRAALVSARDLGAKPSPAALVRKVAAALGRKAEIEAELSREHSMPRAGDLSRALTLLHGTWILIDDAEALAAEQHEFTGTFFSELRHKVQEKKIHWISASTTPLGELFEQRGLTSQFLNDAIKIYAGGLDPTEVKLAIRARLGNRAKEALAVAGTLPGLVHRLCEAEWDDVDDTLRGLSKWAEGLCALWWIRESREQDVLRSIAAGSAYARMPSDHRSIADDLLKRGLLVETETGFALNGGVWEAYVRSK